MLSRKEHDHDGKNFPTEWIDEVTQIFKTTYFEYFKNESRTFCVYGFLYEDELLLIISLADNFTPSSIPTSLFLSVDIDQKTKIKQLIGKLLDATGLFFDEYFNKKENDLYLANWDEAEFHKLKFYYRVTRENIEQTLEATRLLKESGFFDSDSDEEN